MPNWCSNQLVLQHRDTAQIRRAIDAFARVQLLDEFCPCPVELRDFKPEKPGFLEQDQKDANKEKYGFESWYEWSIHHWGTKWDVGDEEFEVEGYEPGDTEVVFYFDSAWKPPITAMEYLETAGFDVKLYYWEPGMAFCGVYTTEAGDKMVEYGQLTAAEAEEAIPDIVDEIFEIVYTLHEYEEATKNDNT